MALRTGITVDYSKFNMYDCSHYIQGRVGYTICNLYSTYSWYSIHYDSQVCTLLSIFPSRDRKSQTDISRMFPYNLCHTCYTHKLKSVYNIIIDNKRLCYRFSGRETNLTGVSNKICYIREIILFK